MRIRRKGRCGVFAGKLCVIHIWALSGRDTDNRRYTSPLPFLSFPNKISFFIISKYWRSTNIIAWYYNVLCVY